VQSRVSVVLCSFSFSFLSAESAALDPDHLDAFGEAIRGREEVRRWMRSVDGFDVATWEDAPTKKQPARGPDACMVGRPI
jgi:hypothetical protein